MATDWADEIRKHAPDARDSHIAGIIRHCGIALRNPDAALVSFTDPAETARVREAFLKRKLGLVAPDSELDGAIAQVGSTMAGDARKPRATVYYLLARHYEKLALFERPTKASRKAEPESLADLATGAVGTLSAAAGGTADMQPAVAEVAAATETLAESLSASVAHAGTALADLVGAAALEATGAVPSTAEVLEHPMRAARNARLVSGGVPLAGAEPPARRDWRWMAWLMLAVLVLLAVWWAIARQPAVDPLASSTVVGSLTVPALTLVPSPADTPTPIAMPAMVVPPGARPVAIALASPRARPHRRIAPAAGGGANSAGADSAGAESIAPAEPAGN